MANKIEAGGKVADKGPRKYTDKTQGRLRPRENGAKPPVHSSSVWNY